MTNLPTREEYIKNDGSFYIDGYKYSEPKYICPKCGGNVRKNLSIVLTTYPPKYEYMCDSCGYSENLFV